MKIIIEMDIVILKKSVVSRIFLKTGVLKKFVYRKRVVRGAERINAYWKFIV